VNYVKLNMYPDGGIVSGCPRIFVRRADVFQARFRVYGLVMPVFPADAAEQFDLAHVFAGGRAVAVSDQHFGVGSNLILPGRGGYNVSSVRSVNLTCSQARIWATAGRPGEAAKKGI
jgi:allantoicase